MFSSINSLWPFLVALYLLRRGKHAEGAACALMDRHTGVWTAIERVELRKGRIFAVG